MISLDLATRLRDAGLQWKPAAGDRFTIPQPELADELFTLSEMTIEAREYPTGTILGFNGTTEWAMDSVAQEETLWMPREDQLRDLLGGTFVALTRIAVDGSVDEQPPAVFRVTTRASSGAHRVFEAPTASDAYGLAVLALVQEALADVGV